MSTQMSTQMSMQMSMYGSEPANIPIYFLYLSNGFYYYSSSCCLVPEHTGIVVSTRYLEPHELGCASAPPPTGPEAPETLTMSADLHLHQPFKTDNELIAIYGRGDIGNGAYALADPVLNPAGVSLLHGPVLVQFATSNTVLEPFLKGGVYQLSAFQVSYFVTHNCHCAGQSPDGAGGSEQPAVNNAGTTDCHPKSQGCQEVVNFVFALAECVRGTPTSTINVDGQFSPEWKNPTDANQVVNAGRLLRLQVIDGDYRGNTLFVVNNVADRSADLNGH